jgi:hypothetical protein
MSDWLPAEQRPQEIVVGNKPSVLGTLSALSSKPSPDGHSRMIGPYEAANITFLNENKQSPLAGVHVSVFMQKDQPIVTVTALCRDEAALEPFINALCDAKLITQDTTKDAGDPPYIKCVAGQWVDEPRVMEGHMFGGWKREDGSESPHIRFLEHQNGQKDAFARDGAVIFSSYHYQPLQQGMYGHDFVIPHEERMVRMERKVTAMLQHLPFENPDFLSFIRGLKTPRAQGATLAALGFDIPALPCGEARNR